MEKITGIYKITNQINGHAYIGLSKNCLKRWNDHYSRSYHPQKQEDYDKPLYKAMRKYGRENFSFEIIEECEIDKLCEREIYWISYYDTYHNGYNATIGGDLPPESAVQRGENHPCAKLTVEDVKKCRQWYKEGKRSKEIWEEYFQHIVKFSTFQNMWHGRTWKYVMPEVFENNPHPRRKYTIEEIQQVKKLFKEGKTCAEVYKMFNGYFSKTLLNDVRNNKQYKDISPAM